MVVAGQIILTILPKSKGVMDKQAYSPEPEKIVKVYIEWFLSHFIQPWWCRYIIYMISYQQCPMAMYEVF